MDNERIDKAIIELQGLMNAGALKSCDFGETYGDSLSLAVESLKFYKEHNEEDKKYGKFSKVELLLMHDIVAEDLEIKLQKNRHKLSEDDAEILISDYNQIFNDMKKAEKKDGTYIFDGLTYDDIRKLYKCTSDIVLNMDNRSYLEFLYNLGINVVRTFNILITQEIQKRMDEKVRNLGGDNSEA